MNKLLAIYLGLVTGFTVIGGYYIINSHFAAQEHIFGVQTSVPSAPGSSYFLASLSTGNYIATTTEPMHAGSFYATSTRDHSVFPYASTTAITATNASTTNLTVSGLNAASCDVKASLAGVLSCGTDATGAGGGVYPFTPGTWAATQVSATSTTIWDKAFLGFIASSSIIDYASSTALTVSGNSYLGTVSSGVWNGTTITTAFGGTGLSNPGSPTIDAVVTFHGSSGATAVSAASDGNALITTGGGGTITFGSINLASTNSVGSSILPLANGGSNASSIGAQLPIVNDGTRLVSTSTLTISRYIATTTLSNIFPYASSTAITAGAYFGTWSGNVIPIAKGGTNNSATYAAGGMIFSDGTSLTQSAGNSPFYDQSNDRVGISDTSPDYRFEGVGSTGNGYFGLTKTGGADGDILAVDTLGNVGIATTTPGTRLAMNGNMFIAGRITSTSTLSSIFPYASTTVLTVDQNTYLAASSGSVGVASTTPYGLLSVNPNGITGLAFVIGSSTGSIFGVRANGGIILSEATSATSTAIIFDWNTARPQTVYNVGTVAFTFTPINATTTINAGSTRRVKFCNPAGSAAGAITWNGVETSGTQVTTAGTCDLWTLETSMGSSTIGNALPTYKVFGLYNGNEI